MGFEASLEVVYSPMRKAEMASYNEANCVSLIGLIQRTIQTIVGSPVREIIPHNKGREIDIIFRFTVADERMLDEIEKAVQKAGGRAIDKVSVFLDDMAFA